MVWMDGLDDLVILVEQVHGGGVGGPHTSRWTGAE